MFQLNEEPLTGQSGPVNLASKMAPDGKTPKKGEKKVKQSSNGKEECTEAHKQSTRRGSSSQQRRPKSLSKSTTPLPSTPLVREGKRSKSIPLPGNQQSARAIHTGIYGLGTWQDELKAGLTMHIHYRSWLEERTRDNRQLTKEWLADNHHEILLAE